MFLFVGGVTPKTVTLRDLPAAECPACDAAGGLQERRVDRVLSLFFVPLLTVHQGRPFLACSGCGWRAGAAAGEDGALSGAGAAPGAAGAGGGADLPQVCRHCGAEVQDGSGWAFCPFCGAGL